MRERRGEVAADAAAQPARDEQLPEAVPQNRERSAGGGKQTVLMQAELKKFGLRSSGSCLQTGDHS